MQYAASKQKEAKRLVGFDLPVSIIQAIDDEAAKEGLTRAAVIRRQLIRIYCPVPKRKSA